MSAIAIDIFNSENMSQQQKKFSQAQRLGQFAPGLPKPMMALVEVASRCSMACPICYSKVTTLRNRGRGMSAVRYQAASAIRDANLCCTLAVMAPGGHQRGRDRRRGTVRGSQYRCGEGGQFPVSCPICRPILNCIWRLKKRKR
jgi:hypothetical protein